MYVVHPKISYSFSGGMVGSRDHCSGRELQKSTCRLVWGDDVGGALRTYMLQELIMHVVLFISKLLLDLVGTDVSRRNIIPNTRKH